jgi:hypothetical protein
MKCVILAGGAGTRISEESVVRPRVELTSYEKSNCMFSDRYMSIEISIKFTVC